MGLFHQRTMEFKLLILAAVLALAAGERKRYDGCQSWRVTPKTEEELSKLRTLYFATEHVREGDGITFWSEPTKKLGIPSEIMVCPQALPEFVQFVSQGIRAEQMNADVQKVLDEQLAKAEVRHRTSAAAYDPTEYNTFEDILAALRDFQGRCPPSFTCTIEELGRTYENRPIELFRIVKSEGGPRPSVFMDSLIHAREWLAGSTNLLILQKFIEDYGSDADVTHLLDSYDWLFAPVLNPDGYSYSWEAERFQRKNLSPTTNPLCPGTDLNRNYDYNWGNPGASPSPCSETYRGNSVASELETQAIQNIGEAEKDNLFLWVTWHSTAYIWLLPYGEEITPGTCFRDEDHFDMQRAGDACVNAITATYNEATWEAGALCEILYPSSGSTMDWAKGKGIVKYSFNPELRGPGFAPSAGEIEPSFRENWNGLIALVNEIEAIESGN